MLEVIISLSIMSIVSVASVWLVFTTLALRDLALATTATSESLRVFGHILSRVVVGANVITSSPTTLFLTSANECWSFVYDANTKQVFYAQTLATGCAPNPNPANVFFPSYTQVDNFIFGVSTLPTGGRQVTVTGVVNTILPFENYQVSFSNTFTNVVD
jgi:hypothetical protein